MKQLKFIIGVIAIFSANSAFAAGSRTLEISGNIASRPNGAKTYLFNEEQFMALPQTTVTTSTMWTPAAKFIGVSMEELMRVTGAKGEFALVSALDDYSVRIPVADFKRFGAILARSMNDKPLEASKFGPYFLIYPKDRYPKELNTPTAEAKFVWQVKRIVFQ